MLQLIVMTIFVFSTTVVAVGSCNAFRLWRLEKSSSQDSWLEAARRDGGLRSAISSNVTSIVSAAILSVVLVIWWYFLSGITINELLDLGGVSDVDMVLAQIFFLSCTALGFGGLLVEDYSLLITRVLRIASPICLFGTYTDLPSLIV